MNIGTLQIEIASNVARLQKDMADAKQAVSGAMGDITKYVDLAKSSLLGLGGALSVKTFIGVIDGAIEAKVKLYDLSLQTGITVEQLSGLGKIAKYSNTDLTDIAGASNKLSKALFTQNEESKGAAQAIKALGLNYAEFKAMSADQQFQAVAHSMAEFEDGTAKSAAAMLLYGRAGAQLLPFLKELEERGYAVGKQTTESALQAKKYEANLISLQGAADAWKRELAEAALPTLLAVTNAFVDGRKEADKYSISSEAIKVTMQTLAVVGANVSFVFGGVGREIAAVLAQWKLLGDVASNNRSLLDPFGSRAAVKAMNSDGYNAISAAVKEDGERALADLQKYEAKILGLKPLSSTTGDFTRTDHDTTPVKRPQLALAAPPADTGPVKEMQDGYAALMAKIKEKVEIDKIELESGRKITESDKFRLEVQKDVEKHLAQLSPARRLAIDQATQTAIAVMKEHEQWEADVKWIKEATEANASYIDSQRDLRDQLQQNQKDADLQLKTYGMTVDQLRAVESARERDTAAALQQKAALADTAYLDDIAKLYRDQADAITATANARDLLAAKQALERDDPMTGADRAVKEYLANIKAAGDATYGAVSNSLKGLEDLTLTALSGSGAKNAAKAWVSGIITEIERLAVVKPLMNSIFGNQASGGSSGGGGWLGTLISAAGSYFGSSGYNYNGDASGSLYSSSGSAIAGRREAGGDVDRGKNYLIGEKGPEILRMGSQSGTVVPNSAIAAAANTAPRAVAVNIVNNGQPVQAKSSQRETDQGTVIELVLEAVASDMSSGGKVHDATQRRFGLNAGGTTPRY